MHSEYDSWGRISKLKARDNCNAVSAGDTIEYTYVSTGTAATDDGLLVKLQYKDSTGSVKYSRSMSYDEARRLATTEFTGEHGTKRSFDYEDDGQLASVTEEGVGKTEWNHDSLGRTELLKRFVSSTLAHDWAIAPGVQNDLPTQVSDPASKDMDWVWDDMGRKVKQITPDSGTTLYLHDPAGNLITRIEDKGGADEKTNVFSYDPLQRLVSVDYGDANCYSLGNAELEYTYDSVSGCPSGACENSLGRLVKVETQLSCLDSEPDDAFDQQTYFGYDYAGRTVKETIEDDGGRSAPQSYEWDKNSNPMAVIAPSGTKMQWDYNYGSYNSDRDKIIRVRRNDGANTYITTAGYWNPFGPMKSYRQYSKVSGSYVRAHFTWDDGYRPTDVQYKTDAGYNLMRTAIGWDGDGNLASRNYTDAYSGVTDDYFTYDYLDQVTRNSMSTSTSSSQVKSRPYYNTSGDRYYLRDATGSTAYLCAG